MVPGGFERVLKNQKAEPSSGKWTDISAVQDNRKRSLRKS